MQRNQGNSVLGAALMLLALLLMPGHAQERAHPLRVTYDSLPGEWTGHRDGLGGTAILMFKGGRPMDRDGAFIEVFDQGVGSIPGSLAEFRQYDFDDTLDWQYEPFEVSGYRGYVARGQRGHRGAAVYFLQVGPHRVMLLADLRGPDQSKWRQEADLVINRLRFCCAPPVAGPPAPGLRPCRAIIHLPVDLQPGQVLSPSYTITDADGGPPVGEVQVRLRINGVWTNSVIWDGNEAVVELQASCHGFPLSVTAIMPAHGTRPPGDVPDVLPSPQEWLDRKLLPLLTAMAAGLDAIPPMGSIGDLPGPADMTQTLVGVLAPGLVTILIGLLGGRAHAPPGSPTTGGGPAQGPRSGPNDQEYGPPPPRSAAETAAGLAPSRRPLTVIGGLQLPDFPEFPPDPGIAGGTPLLDPGAETLADKLMNAVGYVVENPYVQATGQTIADAGTALKDGVGGFLQGLAMIPQGIVSTIGSILSGYVEIGRLGREIYNDISSGRSIIGGRSVLGVGLDTMRRSWDDLWSSVGREMLPIEELKSLFDRNASLEERLWAFPAAVVKGARLLMLPALRGVAASPVPGLGKVPSLIPSVRTAQSLEQLASMQHARAAAAERKLGEIRADRSIRPGKQRSLTRPLEASLTEARNAEATIRGVGDLNGVAPDVAKATTYQQVQRVLEKNPSLSRAVDDLIRNNDGGQTLYDLRRAGLMGKDAHTLITARKLQIQDQVMQAAQRRMLIEEARAIMQQGGKPPTSFHTFNATQGSRTLIRGSNVNADLDSTMLGLKHVTKERSAQILREEAARAGFSQRSLDVNIYRPQVGLADPGGAAPNVQVTLENIGQTTGTGGRYQVHVTAKGKVVVSPHISQQGRESVLQARLAQGGGADAPGLMAWEGHQGRPVTVPREQWPLVREIQLDGLRHAYESGEMNQMVKYANRAQSVGLPLDAPTARLLRAVAGQKDPYLADQLLRRAGIQTPKDLMARLGQKLP